MEEEILDFRPRKLNRRPLTRRQKLLVKLAKELEEGEGLRIVPQRKEGRKYKDATKALLEKFVPEKEFVFTHVFKTEKDKEVWRITLAKEKADRS